MFTQIKLHVPRIIYTFGLYLLLIRKVLLSIQLQVHLLNIFYILLVMCKSYSMFPACLNPARGKRRSRGGHCTESFWHVLSSFALIALVFFSFHLSHQKLDGCNKMTCTGCMQYFCWICMGSLSRANPYKHFTDPASPCFNRYVYIILQSQKQILDHFSQRILLYIFSHIWTSIFSCEFMLKIRHWEILFFILLSEKFQT